MKPLFVIPVCFVALAVPVVVLAGGAQGGFDGVVNSIESRYHIHATHVPFLGLVGLISSKATHDGVSDLHVAEFEHVSGPIDGEELNIIVEQKLGPGWERIIRQTSRTGNEQTLIFMQPEGNKMGLFVLDYDGQEMNVVQVSVDPEHLSENLGHYQHHHQTDSNSDDHDGDKSD
jgi:hypothetical protein